LQKMLAYERKKARRVDAARLPEASKVLQSFQKADADGSGWIDADELASLLKDLNPQITRAQAQHMFKAADIDGDQKVNFGEFIEWIFSDFEEGEALLGKVVAGNHKADGLKTADPKVDENAELMLVVDVEEYLKKELSNAYRSFIATYPDSQGAAEDYIHEQAQRLMSKEFEDRIVGSFGARLDKDGNGTLSYQEVRGMIREVLSADTNSTADTLPTEAEIHKFFDTYNTAAFGQEMSSGAFLNLMRGLNIHLIANNLPVLERKWRSESKRESFLNGGASSRPSA